MDHFACTEYRLKICRNVTLNLQIKNRETERLGLDQHVCELQLNLKAFAVLMVSHFRISSPILFQLWAEVRIQNVGARPLPLYSKCKAF